MMLTCTKCKETKPASAFHQDRSRSSGRRYWCKSCSSHYRSHWVETNPEKIRAKSLRRHHKLTLEEYTAMWDWQQGLCYICGNPPTGKSKWLCVDHDHATNVKRKLLCQSCNKGLGNFKDNIELLRLAISYLEEHQTTKTLQ